MKRRLSILTTLALTLALLAAIASFSSVPLTADARGDLSPLAENTAILLQNGLQQADLAVVSKEIVGLPAQIPPDQAVEFTVVEKVANNGPSGPVLAEVFQVLFPPEECAVSFHVTEELLALVGLLEVTVGDDVVAVGPPAGAMFEADPGVPLSIRLQVSLESDGMAELMERWDVRCGQAGTYDLEFVKVVLPADDGQVDDPDQANNELEQAFSVVVAADEGVCGDQNDDGVVDIFDAMTDLHIIVGAIQPTAEQLRLSDVVRDGKINIFDVIMTLQHIVGLVTIVECGPPING